MPTDRDANFTSFDWAEAVAQPAEGKSFKQSMGGTLREGGRSYVLAGLLAPSGVSNVRPISEAAFEQESVAPTSLSN